MKQSLTERACHRSRKPCFARSSGPRKAPRTSFLVLQPVAERESCISAFYTVFHARRVQRRLLCRRQRGSGQIDSNDFIFSSVSRNSCFGRAFGILLRAWQLDSSYRHHVVGIRCRLLATSLARRRGQGDIVDETIRSSCSSPWRLGRA